MPKAQEGHQDHREEILDQEGTILEAVGRACCQKQGGLLAPEDHRGPIVLVAVGHRRSCWEEDIVVDRRRLVGSGVAVVHVALLVPAMF